MDVLNLGLMLVALALAFILPFWLFLFSYAVLGPLHYLTEIGWLNKKQFFTTGKLDYLPLVLVAIIWSGLYLFVELFYSLPIELKEKWLGTDWFVVLKSLQTKLPDLLLAAFIAAVVMAFAKKWWVKMLAILAGFFSGMAMSYLNLALYHHLIGVLLPTLIHVFAFTGLFMLYGAIKSKSVYGYMSVLLLLACGVCCFAIPSASAVHESGTAVDAYRSSNFHSVNATILNFNLPQPWDYSNTSLFSELGVQLQRFIAFSYTYHYLNWFSKTSIIGWHKIPRRNIFISMFIWVGSVALYLYNYRMGLKVLLFLSILHVILEFPLNAQSFVGVVRGVFIRSK